MISNPHITIAETNDIPQIVSLINSAYRGEGSKKGWTSEAELFHGVRTNEEALMNILAENNAVMLKYKNDDEAIIGCVYLEKQDGKIYLGLLSVSPDIQASGVGKQLLTASEEYARVYGYDKISMTVITIRKELVEWYQRRGYKPTGEIKQFPEDKINTPNQRLELLVLEKEV
jgi:ribosomal protein S18 acetylase RimI-like enzyme